MAFGISENPQLRKLLGWNPLSPPRPRLPGMMSQEDVSMAEEEDLPLGPFSEENAPEIVHVDQQIAAAAKSPTITPAAGSRRKGISIFDAGRAMSQGLFDVAGAVAPVIGSGLHAAAQGASDLFGGPDLPEMSIAHAAGIGGAASAPIMDDAERRRRAAAINEGNRVSTPAAPAAAHPTDAAALTRHETPPRTTVPSAEWRQPYGDEDLNIEKAARLRGEGPSRGGVFQGKTEDVAYLPDSVLEEATNRRMLAEVQRKPGALSGAQEAQLEFGKQQGEIKFAAMDKIIDAERDRRIAEAQAAQAPPERKAAAIKFAMEDADDKKLRNRQIGMAGWPRRQADDLDPFSGEPMTPSYGGVPGGR